MVEADNTLKPYVCKVLRNKTHKYSKTKSLYMMAFISHCVKQIENKIFISLAVRSSDRLGPKIIL